MDEGDSPSVAPPPEDLHALDCAWCGRFFQNIVDLLSHVDASHLDSRAA